MRLIAVLCCAAIAGCGSMPSFFSVPTPVRCAPKDAPVVPRISSNALLAKMDDYHLVLLIAAERGDLVDYAGKADAVIQACK